MRIAGQYGRILHWHFGQHVARERKGDHRAGLGPWLVVLGRMQWVGAGLAAIWQISIGPLVWQSLSRLRCAFRRRLRTRNTVLAFKMMKLSSGRQALTADQCLQHPCKTKPRPLTSRS